MKISRAIDKANVVRGKEIIEDDPPKPGTVVSWDRHPRFAQTANGKRGRKVAVVGDPEKLGRDPEERYVILKELGGKHWFDWSTESFCAKVRQGVITIEDPWELLNLLREAFELQDNPNASEALEDVLVTWGKMEYDVTT